MGPPPFTLPLEKRPKCTEEKGYCSVRNHPTLKEVRNSLYFAHKSEQNSSGTAYLSGQLNWTLLSRWWHHSAGESTGCPPGALIPPPLDHSTGFGGLFCNTVAVFQEQVFSEQKVRAASVWRLGPGSWHGGTSIPVSGHIHHRACTHLGGKQRTRISVGEGSKSLQPSASVGPGRLEPSVRAPRQHQPTPFS